MADYDALYLAPHLDDVALSCGGQIAQRTAAGEKVLVVTIMAGDPPQLEQTSAFVDELHTRWGLAETAVAARREEDRQANLVLGASWHHAKWGDCIYRLAPTTSQTMYHSNADIFGSINGNELYIVDEIAQSFANLPSARSVISPLAIGNHVDHQITRLATERYFGADHLLYYEDYPYAGDDSARQAVLNNGLQVAQQITLDKAAVQKKYEAIFCYQSQVSTFFSSFADMSEKIGVYHASVGGELLWRSTDALL